MCWTDVLHFGRGFYLVGRTVFYRKHLSALEVSALVPALLLVMFARLCMTSEGSPFFTDTSSTLPFLKVVPTSRVCAL